MRGKGGGWVAVCGVSANEYSCAHGAQINFGDPTPYLTYGNSQVGRGVTKFVGSAIKNRTRHGYGAVWRNLVGEVR
jgi:hypothetical protein